MSDVLATESISKYGVDDQSSGAHYALPLRIRNCSNFKFDPSEFPQFIKKAMKASMDADLSTGFRDVLIKHEISEGRPVLLSCAIPVAKIFDEKHPKDGKQEIIIKKGRYSGAIVDHAMLVVGYKPDPENPKATLYEFLNSWGSEWGNKGYGWINSEYLDLFETSSVSCSVYSLAVSQH